MKSWEGEQVGRSATLMPKWLLWGPAILSGFCGCTPAAPAEAPPPSDSEVESTPEPEAAAAPPAETPQQEEPVEAEPAPPPGPSPTELVGEICAEICGKVKESCSQRAASFCNASCGDYVSGAEQCPTEVHAALSCQRSADDFLLCSNIAAESCGPLYKEMKDCREGRAAPQPWGVESEETNDEKHPAGFARLKVEAGGFSNLAPEGARVEALDGGKFRASATSGSFEYVIESVAHDNKKPPNAVTLLRTTTKYVGNDCQPKLRLHGRYETQGVVHTRFDTVCADGTEIRGMMHYWGENIVAVSARNSAAGADNPNLEPYIFSFELDQAD